MNNGIMKYSNYDIGSTPPHVPLVTVITPVYNRKSIVKRTFTSVMNQTFRDFEYIIVDDGSVDTESIDDIVFDLMEQNKNIQISYYKKPNGGVHTARNLAIKNARGTFAVCLDSDDELVPDALQTLIKVWNKIPNKDKIREVVCQCVNENGKRVGAPFPDNINNLPFNQAMKACRATKGEHSGLLLLQPLKDNPWPEYKGVKFVEESIVWDKLEKAGWKSYFINDMLRIYHTENNDHLSGVHKKTTQNVINSYFNCVYRLNHPDYYKISFTDRVNILLRMSIMDKLITKNDFNKIKLESVFDNTVFLLMYIPAIFAAKYYKKKRF